jgi:hypothetical protein
VTAGGADGPFGAAVGRTGGPSSDTRGPYGLPSHATGRTHDVGTATEVEDATVRHPRRP